MATTIILRITRIAVFIGVIIIVLAALYAWRDARVDAILEDARPGDVIDVQPDECNGLRARGFIDPNTYCGYRRKSVRVRIIKTPEQNR